MREYEGEVAFRDYNFPKIHNLIWNLKYKTGMMMSGTVVSCSHLIGAGLPEECLQVTTSKQLQNNEAWVLVKADTNEVNDVWVGELAHNQCLHEEVSFGLVG
jgi:hypothetical protein